VTFGRSAATSCGPKLRFGTKWLSITSTWIQSAPAAWTARHSAPKAEKSAARMEGAIRTDMAWLLAVRPWGRLGRNATKGSGMSTVAGGRRPGRPKAATAESRHGHLAENRR